MTMARERRRFEIVDNRDEIHTNTGGKPYLKLPPGLQLFKPPKHPFRIEIVPFLVTNEHSRYVPGIRFSRPGGLYYERTLYFHEGVGPDNQRFTCNAATFGGKCYLCEVRADLKTRPDKESRDTAYNMRPKEDQLFLVNLRDDRSGALTTTELWDVKNFLFGKQLDDYRAAADPEDRESYRRFFDPDEGYTIKVTPSEESMGQGGGKYTFFSVHEFKKRREPLPDDLLDHGYDLDAMVRMADYETFRRLWTGEADDLDSGEARERVAVFRSEMGPIPREIEQEPQVEPPTVPVVEPEPEPQSIPEPAAVPVFQNGQWVHWLDFKTKKPLSGTVVAVNRQKQILQVKTDGTGHQAMIDFSEVVVPSPVPEKTEPVMAEGDGWEFGDPEPVSPPPANTGPAPAKSRPTPPAEPAPARPARPKKP
jgi:hypothetical protein